MTDEPSTGGRRRLLALIPAVVFFVLAGFFLVALFNGDPSRVPSALIGREVPVFDLPPVEGLPHPGLADGNLRGGKASIVNVWASWCVPCREEMPMLVEFRQKHPEVPLYGINYKDDPRAARRFLSELGDPFDRIGADARGQASIDWGVYGVPETYVVDGEGRIVVKHVGPLTPESIENDILPALRAANPATPAAGQ
ncbi:DsbE family thiol:disulfide interchange protein [Parvibaculum sp.]|mgnify:CR=1 FL=1|uniref:DsbE family thiol:disulfide interchange protein n=1 Tax=Parvibaculum sp. TaxID=2024848 RepID=UPI000C97FC82|nr:DsbE family thiol:disulfide interchange protein [Parvibaculum sp.]MAB13670.1 DsbE family thiol:disulfide interchange protein [Parvibaculum sp.]